MKKIYRRDFEIQIENNINVIVCTIDNDDSCVKCVEELDEFSKKYPMTEFSEYNVIMDVDINEKYDISYPPYILIFQDGKLINKFGYTNIQDFSEKLQSTF